MRTILNKYKWLILILLLAAVLRLWKLGENPPHLTSDEAALGYNTYSILKTGRDEHGKFLPIIFKSFGDWKPGLYIYVTIPFVALFGLTEFAVRLPSAVLGIIAVAMMYLVMGELFKKNSIQYSISNVQYLASFLLTVSPWHLQFSRGAWEANLALTLTLGGIYAFFRSIGDKPRWLILSAVFFGLTLWTYQGAKLATLVILLVLGVFYRKKIFSLSSKTLFVSLLVLIGFALPIVTSFLDGRTGRLEVFSIFSYSRPEEYTASILRQGGETKTRLSYFLYHSEPLNFARGILSRWFNHYSGRFLFFEGDWQNPRHGVPHAGALLYTDSLILLFGLISLAQLKNKKISRLMLLWLLVAPLPAALSRDSVHAVRSLNMVVPLMFILALGVNYLWSQRRLLGEFLPIGLIICGFAYVGNYVYYLDQYWVHAPKKNSQYWQYGYKRVVQAVTSVQNKYEKIIMQQSYEQPYIFFLFYQRYDPQEYQKVVDDVFIPSDYGDVGLVSRLGNIEFKDIDWPGDIEAGNNLLVIDPDRIGEAELVKSANIVNKIEYLDGKTAFMIIQR